MKGKISSSLRVAILVVFAALFAVQTVSSQTSENKTDTIADKTLRSNARINPTTLAMELSIPLPSYPGRAGASLSNSISYSSKVWNASIPSYYSTISGPKSQISAQYALGSWAGWTSTLGVPQLDTTVEAYTEAGGAWRYDPMLDAGSDFNIVYVKRFRIVMPDGSMHEMRADDMFHPYGTAVSPGGISDADFYGGPFLSVDGSRMRLEFNNVGGVYHSTLYMPDGSRYIDLPQWNSGAAGGGTKYYDVNGNKMTYNVTSGVASWTDTMGRTLTDPLPRSGQSVQPTASGTPSYTYPTRTSGGSSPAAQTVQYTWANLDTQQSSLKYSSGVYCSGATTTIIPDGISNGLFATPGGNFRVCGTNVRFDPIVLTAVALPNGAKYSFHYNIYGEMDRIDYPTGGYERFVYANATPIASAGDNSYDQFNRVVTDRYISEDGSTEVHWTYKAVKDTTSGASGPYHIWTKAPDNTCTEQLFYDQYSHTGTSYGFGSTVVGKEYESHAFTTCTISTTVTPGTLLRRSITSYTQTGPLTTGGLYDIGAAFRDVRPNREVSMIFEPGSGSTSALISMGETTYDTSGSSDASYFSSLNAKQSKAYNYVVQAASTAASASIATAAGWFSSGDVAVINESDFLYDSNYKARDITGLPTETRIKDLSGNIKAKTQFTYDESSYITSTSGSMPGAATGSWLDPTGSGTDQLGATIGAKRGFPTTVRHFYDIASSLYIDTHTFVDQYGNGVKSRDGRGNDTTTAYDASYAFAYPTSVTTAVPDSTGTYGSSSAFTATTTYDYNTGLKITTTDPNSLVTEYEYVDALLRPTKVTPKYAGSQVGSQTLIEYGTPSSGIYTTGQRYVKTSSQIDSTYWKVGYSWSDGLGRSWKSQMVDSGGDIYKLSCYDSMGRVQKTSNPFVTGGSGSTCSSGLEWTSATFDELGRTISTTTPDSSVASSAFGLSTSSPIGMTTTVTDQAGKLRRSITNAVGQLARVDEPDNSSSTGSLGAVTSPNQTTSYGYDPLNNLTSVTQGSQTRTFTYDALARLKSAANPESGTTNYTYDANGNLSTKADARSITTSYTYDPLNRITQRSYNDGTTPTVNYYYDNLTNAKGKLIKTNSSVSTTEYTGFDSMGRVTSHKQTTGGTPYITGYTYNLSGELLEETYPSGRKVRNTLNANGDLSLLETQPSGGSYATRATSFTYSPAGAVTAMQLGNSRWESTTFNNRLQPTQIALGTTSGATNVLRLDYTYGTTNNNGNVQTQTITVPGMSFPLLQTYAYDSLNRLGSATETSNGTQTWKQEFSYDRYGNRNFVTGAGHTDTLAGCTTMCNPTFDSTTNRITSSGYSFDNTGNTTADPLGRTFVYNAENKQTSASNSGGTIGTYSYDGDGRRVKKLTSTGDNVIFVYDASGELIEEFPVSSPTTVSTAYVYAGSRLLSTETSSGTNYLTSDTLGSPRINTDGSGTVISRHDYHPFGEEIGGVGGRTTGLNYGSDWVRKQFTGYERDGESGLDFAQARYMSSSIGRFSSPDPLTRSMKVWAPQSFNRYSYVGNNPTSYVDPSGLCQVNGGKEDGKPCADFSGQVYTDAKGGFTNFKCDGCTAYTGGTLLSVIGGMNVQITGGGWTTLGAAESSVAASVAVEADYGALEDSIITVGESVVSTATTARPLLLPAVIGAPGIILGAAQTVGAPNCPSNVCAGGTGAPLPDYNPQVDLQPDTGQGPATTTEEQPPGEPVFQRNGEARQSLTTLAAQAEDAERAGFGYGISVNLVPRPTTSNSRVASIGAANAAFQVNPTPTRRLPNHHTVIFPKPLTPATVNRFYNIFRRP